MGAARDLNGKTFCELNKIANLTNHTVCGRGSVVIFVKKNTITATYKVKSFNHNCFNMSPIYFILSVS